LNKQENTQKEATSHKVKKHKKAGSTFLNLNSLLSVLIIIATGFVSYTGWQKISQQQSLIAAQQQQLKQLQRQQAQVSEQVQKQLQQNTLKQNQELNTLKETITAFLKQNQHSRRDWLIAEAEYLIKLANHRLVLVRDVATSIRALRAADDRLREVGNPRFIPLRQALAFDIQQLNSTPIIDIVGLSLKLNTLQKQIEALPLKTPDPKTIEKKNQQETQLSQADGWRKIPAAIWQDLLKLFQIQRHNERIQPLLSPEHRFFLVQNLKLQLEQARLALLNNQPIIYKDRIQQAQQWIKRYFNNQNSLSESINKSLAELAQAKLNVTLPDISSTLTKVQLLNSGKSKPAKTKSGVKKSMQKNNIQKSNPEKPRPQKKETTNEKPAAKNKTQVGKPEKTDGETPYIKPAAKENNDSTI